MQPKVHNPLPFSLVKDKYTIGEGIKYENKMDNGISNTEYYR